MQIKRIGRARAEVELARKLAPIVAEILEGEHGTKHAPGVRKDFCPLCQEGAADG